MTTARLVDVPTPERVLCIYAHPDDAEFFAGGTLAKWASEGAQISLFLITSGDKGSGDLTLWNGDSLIQTREAEARAAAEKLGMKEVIFLRAKDGEIMRSLHLRRHIVRMIRLKKPDAVMSSDPLYRWRGNNRLNHPDHWTVAQLVQDAVYPAARDHLNFPELFQDEGLEPHKTRWLYLALPTDPNYQVEITDHRQTQVEALKHHASQVGEDFAERMAERFDKELTGDGAPRYTEFFRLIDLEA